jgi:hypothetical protein
MRHTGLPAGAAKVGVWIGDRIPVGDTSSAYGVAPRIPVRLTPLGVTPANHRCWLQRR